MQPNHEVYFWLTDAILTPLRITNPTLLLILTIMKMIRGFSTSPFKRFQKTKLFGLRQTIIIRTRTRPLDATVLPTTFPQRGVAGLHMEPNSSYSVMSEAPTDHCCTAVAAGHAGNFGATRTHNSNCQQIKTRGEKSLQNVSWQQKYFQVIKAAALRQLFCWWIFSHETMI